jgi:ribosome-binding factor A
MPQGSAPSQRQLRAGELIRHALADILLRGETNDPELESLNASVHEVQVSPDLRFATAYVSTLIKGQEERALAALNRNKKYIRGLLARRIEMKFMPEVRYRIDTALDYASKIDQLLHRPEVARDLGKNDE